MDPNLSTAQSHISYSPLSLSSSEIRLLQLEPGSAGEIIKCSLFRVDLNDSPQYEALSYMWGPKDTKPLELNGKAYLVRENLWQALNHLRFQDQPRILWIDALCIDQNNVLERNHQVMQMHLIYKMAERVAVWLGLEDELSSLAFQTITSNTKSNRLESEENSVLKVPVAQLRAVEIFCYRAYWTRLWIVQEILSAQEILIYCGSSCLGWQIFHKFLRNCTWSVTGPQSSEWPFQKPVLEAIRHSIPFRLCHDRRRAEESLLYDLCVKYGQSSCENPRDKIFGLQSMTMACCRNASPINYSAPTLEICRDLLMHAISHENPLGVEASAPLRTAERQAHELRKALNIQQFSISSCEYFIRSLSFFEPIEIMPKRSPPQSPASSPIVPPQSSLRLPPIQYINLETLEKIGGF